MVRLDGFVFSTKTGEPLDASNVYHELQKLLAKAGLPRARVHDLRHGAASYLLACGVPSTTILQIMGWSQLSMLKRYGHVTDTMLGDAATRLDQHHALIFGTAYDAQAT